MADDLRSISPLPKPERNLSRREQAIEVAIFLSLIVPSMVISLVAVRQGQLSFIVTASATIARDLALTGLVLFFVWRNGETPREIGWTSRSWRKYAALGVLLFPLVLFGAALLERALLNLGLSAPPMQLPSFLSFRGWIELPLAVVLVIVVAIAEETIFRGYLILRLTSVTGSVRAAAVLSAVVFSLGHGYEGVAGLTTVGVMGLAFAVVYLRTGSLVAPIVMHFLQDFVGIVLAPLFTNAH